jgi:hypothetical protein
MRSISFVLLIFLTGVQFGGVSQLNVSWQNPSGTCDAILDVSKPPQFISFERWAAGIPERAKDRLQRVWLRFHNDTSCPIILPTGSAHLTKLPNGALTFDLQDGAEAQVNYETKNTRRMEAPKRVYAGDEIIVSRLPAGYSIVFSVLLAHFKNRLDIVVPFRYQWESASSPYSGPVFHRVYFRADDLPKQPTPDPQR